MPLRSKYLPALLFGAASLLAAGNSAAGLSRYCDAPAPTSAAQQDKLLRVAGLIREQLDASGASVALISRSGLDLSRFGMRYSHAGLSLVASKNVPWSVRQLYFSCDERRPRIFDQGLAGFVLGTDNPDLGFISLVLLSGEPARMLELAALDDRLALELLGENYSANAFAFSTLYQNCNQWLAELIAHAWSPSAAQLPGDARSKAQAWLKQQAYEPTVFKITNPFVMLFARLIPWIHAKDHPDEDLQQAVFRVSMPAAIEAFVQRQTPGARRIEICHTDKLLVLRHGWEALSPGCVPGVSDTVIALD